MRRAFFVDRRRPARKNQPARLAAAQFVNRGVEGDDFGVDAKLAHAPRDQLRILSAEVEDENGFMFVGHNTLNEIIRGRLAQRKARASARGLNSSLRKTTGGKC